MIFLVHIKYILKLNQKYNKSIINYKIILFLYLKSQSIINRYNFKLKKNEGKFNFKI